MENAVTVRAYDDKVAELQDHILQLEVALAEYAERFGLTDKARTAFNFRSQPPIRTPDPHKPPQ